jgi:hypothetical protein
MKAFFFLFPILVFMFSVNCSAGYAQLPAEIANAAGENRLLLLQSWTPDPARDVTLACVVITPEGHHERDLSNLVIYIGTKHIFSFSPLEFPLSMFLTAETKGNLATIWVSADGSYHLWVFSFSAGSLKPVLKAASKLMPEFVYPSVSPGSLIVNTADLARLGSGYWSQRIIVFNLKWIIDPNSGARRYEPVTADVYVWDGMDYRVRRDWSAALKLSQI